MDGRPSRPFSGGGKMEVRSGGPSARAGGREKTIVLVPPLRLLIHSFPRLRRCEHQQLSSPSGHETMPPRRCVLELTEGVCVIEPQPQVAIPVESLL